MSDVTTIDINHICRDSKFSQIELFSWKIVFICNECKLEKNLFCIDLSKYRHITNFFGILCLWSLKSKTLWQLSWSPIQAVKIDVDLRVCNVDSVCQCCLQTPFYTCQLWHCLLRTPPKPANQLLCYTPDECESHWTWTTSAAQQASVHWPQQSSHLIQQQQDPEEALLIQSVHLLHLWYPVLQQWNLCRMLRSWRGGWQF